MKKLNKIQNIVFIAGAVLLLIGAATFFTGWLYAFYFYAVGACAFAAMQLCAGYEGDNLVIRRAPDGLRRNKHTPPGVS